MATKTIIKGAIYQSGNELLRPHYSGNYYCVDCTEYKTKEEIKANYGNDFFKTATGKNGRYLTYDGVKYYECEFSPFNTDDFVLLSDISKLEFFDEETEF